MAFSWSATIIIREGYAWEYSSGEAPSCVPTYLPATCEGRSGITTYSFFTMFGTLRTMARRGENNMFMFFYRYDNPWYTVGRSIAYWTYRERKLLQALDAHTHTSYNTRLYSFLQRQALLVYNICYHYNVLTISVLAVAYGLMDLGWSGAVHLSSPVRERRTWASQRH